MEVNCAFSKSLILKLSLSIIIVPLSFIDVRFAFSAAGFIATNTSASSPGEKTDVLPNCILKPLTPATVPCGALISAGKSGKVDKSLPIKAVVLLNCEPVSCIPSPESPANLITTSSSSSIFFVIITFLLCKVTI